MAAFVASRSFAAMARANASAATLLILACNGYGGNPELVRRFIPEMADALYFGHPGNRGDAVIWGEALGAQLAHLGAYQGHGSVATPHNILITWVVIMQGGIQVNTRGPAFLRRVAGIFRASRGRVAAAGRNSLERIRCANCFSGAAVRGFPQCRAGRCDAERGQHRGDCACDACSGRGFRCGMGGS